MSFTPKATTTAAALFGLGIGLALLLSFTLWKKRPAEEADPDAPPNSAVDDAPLSPARPDGQVGPPPPRSPVDDGLALHSAEALDPSAAPALAEPRVSLGGPESVRSVMKRRETELNACYGEHGPSPSKATEESSVELQIQVTASGSVTDVIIPWSAGPPPLRRCLEGVIRRTRFARSKKPMEIRYPFVPTSEISRETGHANPE